MLKLESTTKLTTMTKDFLQTHFVRSTVAMTVRQDLAKATTSPEKGLGRPLRIVVAILKSRHPGGQITTEIHPLDMATMGRDNSLGTIVATIDSSNRSSSQNRPDYSNNGNSNQNQNQSRNNSNYEIRQYNNNSMSNSNFNFQKIRDITPAETKTMRDSTRIPHIVPKTMIGM